VYWWAGAIAAVACAGLAALVGLRAPASPWLRAADVALAALVGAVLLQLVPLPVEVVRLISPARLAFHDATALLPAEAPRMLPLSVDPAATGHALLTLFTIALTFWTARALFARAGVRTFTIVLAWGAIALVLAAFAQHAAGTPLVYGVWQPRDAGARPLGPFINRNHTGTWSLLTLWLCVGYLQLRAASSSGRARGWRVRLRQALDARALVLALAVVLLAAGIALGSSRSALVALACGAGYVALAAMLDVRKAGVGWSLAALAAVGAIAMLGYGDSERLLARVDETRQVGVANRLAIWRDAGPLARDFAVTGSGAGTFGSAMRLYQTSNRDYHYNEAHNQYVQLAAEGGLLLALPALAAVVALCVEGWRRLRRHGDPLHWMRVGATAGLIAVSVQSIWETGLTLPANGMLAAAVAAIAVHEKRH
jgi:O-antigen ligase